MLEMTKYFTKEELILWRSCAIDIRIPPQKLDLD